MHEVMDFRIRMWARRTITWCAVVAALSLWAPDAQSQAQAPSEERQAIGQRLNDLFIAIYTNSGVMNGIFENCVNVPGAAGEFFGAVHKRYVRNDTVIAGMILGVHRKVMERQVATGSPGNVERISNDSRDLAYSEIKRKFIVADGRPELERRLCDDLMAQFRAGKWDNPRFVDRYFELLEEFDPRIYEEFYDIKAVLDDMRSGKLRTGTLPKQKQQ